MVKKLSLLLSACIIALAGHAQLSPVITSWIQNNTATGYGGILSNVQVVQYDTTDVYVSATCIPGYDIGPWPGDPNLPTNMNFVYKITRNPAPNTSTPTAVGLGHVGVFTNGVSIFNTQDANSYNSLGVWTQNAYVFEGSSFDDCLGHPAPGGEYHHHVSPKCLYDITDSTHHSPIIGYAFDGYPVYGAYGYSDTNGTGGIRRMQSSFQLRTMVNRDTLPDSTTALPVAQDGPPVSSTYPLGSYQQDYVYVAGSGDLDVHNGRWCRTPDYPNGTYAYFVTLDANLLPQYPYTIGLTYYGIVQPGNTDPGGGHNTPPGGTVIYSTEGVTNVTSKAFTAEVYPNPAAYYLNVFIDPIATNNFTATLTDVKGSIVLTKNNIQPAILYSLPISTLPAADYVLTLKNSAITYTQKIVVSK